MDTFFFCVTTRQELTHLLSEFSLGKSRIATQLHHFILNQVSWVLNRKLASVEVSSSHTLWTAQVHTVWYRSVVFTNTVWRWCYLGDLGAAVSIRHLVGEVSLLKACGAHPLIGGRVWARRRVRRIEAGLDQSFARLWRDHGLQLPGGKRVHMTRLTGDQQQHLSTGQRRQLVRLQEEEEADEGSLTLTHTHTHTHRYLSRCEDNKLILTLWTR